MRCTCRCKPFDATTRELIELGPAAWLEYLGIPVPDPNRVRVDRLQPFDDHRRGRQGVVDRGSGSPGSSTSSSRPGRDHRLDERVQLYNTLLSYRFRIPVRTSLVLLRPEADGPELTGELGEASSLGRKERLVRV